MSDARPQHRELHALLFTNSVWVLKRPTVIFKGCETGPPSYSPYQRRLESLTICWCNYKGSTFYSVFQDLECWSGRSRTHYLPCNSPMLNQLSHRWQSYLTLRSCIGHVWQKKQTNILSLPPPPNNICQKRANANYHMQELLQLVDW